MAIQNKGFPDDERGGVKNEGEIYVIVILRWKVCLFNLFLSGELGTRLFLGQNQKPPSYLEQLHIYSTEQYHSSCLHFLSVFSE